MDLVGSPQLSQVAGKVGHPPVIFLAILIEEGGGFFNRGETRADLKCERKQPSPI